MTTTLGSMDDQNDKLPASRDTSAAKSGSLGE
jgi:hypothetical protein